VAADDALPPPASLATPEPLRDAFPTHTWMDELS
jgi:hypothetical protein